MDHFQFPVGTRVWKEFAKGGKRLETRLLEKKDDGSWRYGSYVWNEDETEATWTTGGASNLKGTAHDVPSEADCQRCHDGEPDRVLGFSAIQLAKGTPDLKSISAWLKVAPDAAKDYGAPGDATESAALGYLHANCGNCHNPNDALVFIAAGIDLRLRVDERDVKTTQLYTTTVNQSTEKFLSVPYRIEGGSADKSAVWLRMNTRDAKDAMPPLGSEVVHTSGLALVKTWIDTLPKP